VSHERILDKGQRAIGDVFVTRHASGERTEAEHARRESDVEQPRAEHRGHQQEQSWTVLIVAMHHDHDIGAALQSEPVTGRLVGPITFVAVTRDRGDSELPRHL